MAEPLALQHVDLGNALGFLRVNEDSHDFLSLATDRQLLETLNSSGARIGSEAVRFSDDVLVFGKKGKSSERELVMTNTTIYIFKSGSHKKADRRVPLPAVSGVMKLADSGDILIRLHSGPDMLLKAARAEEAVQSLTEEYGKLVGEPLRVGRPRSSSLSGMANFDREEISVPLSPVATSPVARTPRQGDFSATPSSPTAGRARMEIFEGWLAKQSPSVGSDTWRRRWFVMNDHALSYFEPKLRTHTKIGEGKVKNIGSHAGDLIEVLDDAPECHKFLTFLRDHHFSVNEVLCYLDIKAFERCPSASPEQLKFVQLIESKYIDEGSDHSMPVSDANKRVVDALIRSGVTRADSLVELKKSVLDKLTDDAFPKYQLKNQQKRRRRSFFDKDFDQATCPEGLHAFKYEPTKGKVTVFASETVVETLKWVQALEDLFHNMNVGRVDEHLHMEGWLHTFQSNGSWKRGYLVLHKGQLFEYDMKYKGSVPLAGARLATQVVDSVGATAPTLSANAAEAGGFTSLSRFSFRFNMTTRSGDMYCLAADCRDELLEWLMQAQRRMDTDGAHTATFMSHRALQALAQKAPQGDVAIVFTDVQNSTDLWERVPADMEIALKAHDHELRRLLMQYQGYEVKTEGDAFMLTFSNPWLAAQWCIAVQKALVSVNWPQGLLTEKSASYVPSTDTEAPLFKGIRVRMGIHYGTPNCRENPRTHRMDYFGNPINMAARVADSAHGGQIVVTQETKDFLDAYDKASAAEAAVKGDASPEEVHQFSVAPLGEHSYKGIREAVGVHHLIPDGTLSQRKFARLRTHEEPAEEEE